MDFFKGKKNIIGIYTAGLLFYISLFEVKNSDIGPKGTFLLEDIN